MVNIFFDVGVVIIIATLLAYMARLFKQPIIPAYILAGLILGPYLGLVTDLETIRTTSEIGIALLLFIVGLEMNLDKLKQVSLISTVGGTIQTGLIFIAGYILAIKLGIFSAQEAIYIGLIVAFSSTMIVIKLLGDKRQIDTLHGRIIIGILLMQDIIAILALSFLQTLDNFAAYYLLIALVKGAVVLLIAYIFRGLLFPTFFKYAARSTEMLFMVSVTICFFFAILFTYFGFSIAIGAFIAGLTIANLPYSIEIISRVKSLRDFFSTIFFVSLGLELTFSGMASLIFPLLGLLVIVVVIKPLVIMVISSLFGYKERTSFLASISLAQISEFSLIIVAQGMLLGHVSKTIFSVTVILAIITLSLTSYFINFDSQIYEKQKKYLRIFGRLNRGEELQYLPKKQERDAILCGYDRIGYSIYKKLKKMGKDVLVVDFNPEVIKRLINQGTPCIYGDINDSEVLDRLDLKNVKMVVSTIPNQNGNIMLIRKIREINKKAIIFVTANMVDEALHLYEVGADYVILPHFLGGDHVAFLIEDFCNDVGNVLKTKFNHIKELRKRKGLGHEHPIKESHYRRR